MAKRALLIASQTAGLRGCEPDAELMGDVLGDWGFGCTALSGPDASREGIIDGYRGLINETSSGDAVVVYYSGHGGRIRNVASINEQTDAHWQFIVPTDFDRSTPDDFRGLLADELRALQLELTTKTDNVTTVLDCCHSALMSRDPALVARFLQRPWNELRPGATARAASAAESVRAALAMAGTERADAESNQRAVRLVACLPTESAFEMASHALDGVHGLLTEAVAGLLREARPSGRGPDAPVTWDDLGRQARAWVLARTPSQHVVAEGPTRRLLFSSADHDAAGGWPVEVLDGVAVLPAAALLGIGPGDVVRILAGGAAAEPLEATVERIDAGRAVLALVDGAGIGRLGAAAVAFVTTSRAARQPVVVEPEQGAARAIVTAAIDASPRLESVDATPAPLARVVVGDDGMLLVGAEGMPYYAVPRPIDDTQLRRLTADLEQLAKVAIVRRLTSGSGEEALEVPVAFTVHAIADGPALEAGVTLPVGPAFFRIHHLGGPNDPPVFVNVIDVGQTGDVAVLSAGASPTGVQLTPKQSYTLYGDRGGWLSWPAGLPADEPRPETLIAVFSDGELDVRGLEATGVAARGDGTATAGSLGEVLALASSGIRRSAGPRPSTTAAPLRYRVERFELLLDPGFQIDESRDVSGVARGRSATANVAVRLLELVVRRNRALFSTDVRLDAVFVTRAATGEGNEVSTQTWAFPGVGDGDALSVGELGLFVGAAHEFLEMAIWVSRANQDNPNLPELAGSVLKRLPPTAAVGHIVETVGRALRRAVNRSIGLYRTTLLVPEDLIAGRRPATGLVETQDMAFAYDVVVRDEPGG